MVRPRIFWSDSLDQWSRLVSTNRRASYRVALGSKTSREEMRSEGGRGTLPIGQAARLPLEERTALRKGGGVGREKKQILTRTV
ncbi:hypothetical protein TNCV_4190561 [Trichonephila clavipes]|nr:hypothetical protein TNCV_4190561 [Trichonephila clavipes]